MKKWKKIVLISVGALVLALAVFAVLINHQPDISSFDIERTVNVSLPDILEYNMFEINRSGMLKSEPDAQYSPDYHDETTVYTGKQPNIIMYEYRDKGLMKGGYCYYPDERAVSYYMEDNTLVMFVPDVSEKEFMEIMKSDHSDYGGKLVYYFSEGKLDCINKVIHNIGVLNRIMELRYFNNGKLEYVNYVGYPNLPCVDSWYYDGNLNKISESELY